MKRCPTRAIIIFIVAFFSFSPDTYAGSPLDVRTRLTLEKDKNSRRLSSQQDAPDADPTHYPLLFEFNSDQAIEELLSLGGKVYYTRNNMALGCIPKEHIDEFVRLPYISRLSLSRKASASVDRARAVTGVDAVHQGTDRIHGYDGTGVVTGFCDIGFDPNHPAFHGRVGMMSKYSEYWAQRRLYAPGMSIHTSGAALEIDTVTETHASHVANIMAGGYRGNPYYGVAPGADIAATTSMTSTMGLLCGIEDVIAYA
ncbi:MAG: S8 family serine peptidase, partial [Bacteroidales bacterium]|nr:S8 family serine peptidase [Bacteroidales bacterium]